MNDMTPEMTRAQLAVNHIDDIVALLREVDKVRKETDGKKVATRRTLGPSLKKMFEKMEHIPAALYLDTTPAANLERGDKFRLPNDPTIHECYVYAPDGPEGAANGAAERYYVVDGLIKRLYPSEAVVIEGFAFRTSALTDDDDA